MTILTISRRAVLGGAIAAAGALAMPSILRAQDKSLKVGVYGGYFKKSFDEHIFPEFTKATGIAVESVAEPTGEAWLVQLEQAAKAGQAPADVSMMSQTSTLKGQSTELWPPIDESEDQELWRPAAAIRQQISGRTRRRHRRGGMVHHAGHQHRRLSRRRRTPGRRSGTRPMPTSSACWRWFPTPSCWK